MMNQCPNCGSAEIISDLVAFAHGGGRIGYQPIYVSLQEPEPEKRPFIWVQKSEMTGFHAAICGACGHTELYTTHHKELLAAHKKGYVSQKNI